MYPFPSSAGTLKSGLETLLLFHRETTSLPPSIGGAVVLAAAAATVGARADVVVDPEAAMDHAVSLATADDLVVIAGSTTIIAAALSIAVEW